MNKGWIRAAGGETIDLNVIGVSLNEFEEWNLINLLLRLGPHLFRPGFKARLSSAVEPIIRDHPQFGASSNSRWLLSYKVVKL